MPLASSRATPVARLSLVHQGKAGRSLIKHGGSPSWEMVPITFPQGDHAAGASLRERGGRDGSERMDPRRELERWPTHDEGEGARPQAGECSQRALPQE